MASRFLESARGLWSSRTGPVDNGTNDKLRRTLNSWQIFSIVIGGVIGSGFFSGSSLALSIAGPGGALLAFSLVGCVAIAVMEGICEMIVLWPIPNAMVEFVGAFVDRELSRVIGIGYWYTYSVSFSALIIGAVDLADYWNLSDMWKAILFIIIPIALAAINTRRVEVFGWIELGAGIVKLILVVGLVILMICINRGVGTGGVIGSEFLDDGIQNNDATSSGRFAAMCVAIPLATYSYLGVEMVTMTAFEAKRPAENLRMPARNIAWFVTLIYITTTFMFVLNVKWSNSELPTYYNQGFGALFRSTPKTETSYSAPVLAVTNAGLHAGAVTACFIYSTVSAANIGLYAASRAMYGLARDTRTEPDSPWWLRAMAVLASLEHDSRAPWWAVTLSVLLLCWLPFIGLPKGVSKGELQETLINMGSVSGVLVWSSQCLAHICFYHWRRRHERRLKGDWYNKFRQTSKASHFAYFQPAIAWFGLISTLLIAFFFNSASMWNGKHTGIKFASAYISPILFAFLWVLLKLRRQAPREWFGVDLSDFGKFKNRLQHLNELIYLGDGPLLEEGEDEDFQPLDGIVMTRAERERGTPPTYSGSQVPQIHHDDDEEDDDEHPGDFEPVSTSMNGAANPPGRAAKRTVRRPRGSESEDEGQRAPPQPPPAIKVSGVETMPAGTA